MARITKLELTQINTRLAAELAEVRSELAMLRLDMEIAKHAQPAQPVYTPAGEWFACVEADDEYGSPSSEMVACASYDDAERIADFGVHFEPAQPALVPALPVRTPARAVRRAAPVPTITRYTDGMGRVWEKTRIGNAATSRCISERAQ